MERSEIQDLIAGEIKKVNREMPDEIPPGDNLLKEWGFESIDMAELVARAEQHFKIEIPDSIWKQLTSINAITDFIYDHLKSNE
jgi:acyl carrier protein